MKILAYKGLRFDDYTKDDDGHYWAEICTECVRKHCNIIASEIDDGKTAMGACSVEGCKNTGEDNEHYYIDFDDNFVSFE